MKKHSFIDLGEDILIFSAGVSFLLGITSFLVKLYEDLIFSAVH